MISAAQLTQVATDLHRREVQLKREKQEQREALAKQAIQKPTSSGGLWSRCTAWLSPAQVKPFETVARVITERG